MKIEIEIPKEFEWHFNQDRFEDSLNRLKADTHLMAGMYEQETIDMLVQAFQTAKPAFDVDSVIEDLKKCFGIVKSCSVDYAEGLKDGYERAIDIVRCARGGE